LAVRIITAPCIRSACILLMPRYRSHVARQRATLSMTNPATRFGRKESTSARDACQANEGMLPVPSSHSHRERSYHRNTSISIPLTRIGWRKMPNAGAFPVALATRSHNTSRQASRLIQCRLHARYGYQRSLHASSPFALAWCTALSRFGLVQCPSASSVHIIIFICIRRIITAIAAAATTVNSREGEL
jgi:hypothetical protein